MPQGKCVGWLDGDNLYLDLTSAYAAAQRLAGTDNRLTVSAHMLAKQLDEAGFLQTKEGDRGKLYVRRMILGKRITVYHLAASLITEKGSLGSQSGTKTAEPPAEKGPDLDDGLGTNGTEGTDGTLFPTSISTPEKNGIAPGGKACRRCGRTLAADWVSAWCSAQCVMADEQARVAR
ncbi:MAG: hypothetical protein ACJ789_19485 [Thermomicrobiales bacterium]